MNEIEKPQRPRGDRKFLVLFTVQIKIAALHRLGNPCDIPIAIRVKQKTRKISWFSSLFPLQIKSNFSV